MYICYFLIFFFGFFLLSSLTSCFYFCLAMKNQFVHDFTHFSPPSGICGFIYLLSIYFAIITHINIAIPHSPNNSSCSVCELQYHLFILSLMGTDPRVLCTQILFVVVAKHMGTYSQHGSEEQWKYCYPERWIITKNYTLVLKPAQMINFRN